MGYHSGDRSRSRRDDDSEFFDFSGELSKIIGEDDVNELKAIAKNKDTEELRIVKAELAEALLA